MYVCMHACMHGCLYACMDVWMYVCMYVCLYVCILQHAECHGCTAPVTLPHSDFASADPAAQFATARIHSCAGFSVI